MNDKKLRYLLRWIKNLEKVEINKDEKFYYIANLRVLYKIKKEHMYLNPEAFNTKNGDIIIENMLEDGIEAYMQRIGCTTEDGNRLKALIYSGHGYSIYLDAEIFNTFGANTEVFFNVETGIARIEKMDRRTEETETVGYIKPEVIEKEDE